MPIPRIRAGHPLVHSRPALDQAEMPSKLLRPTTERALQGIRFAEDFESFEGHPRFSGRFLPTLSRRYSATTFIGTLACDPDLGLSARGYPWRIWPFALGDHRILRQ